MCSIVLWNLVSYVTYALKNIVSCGLLLVGGHSCDTGPVTVYGDSDLTMGLDLRSLLTSFIFFVGGGLDSLVDTLRHVEAWSTSRDGCLDWRKT